MTEFATTSTGDRVAYDRYGEGPALIFVAGAGPSRDSDPITTLTAQAVAARGFTTLVYDRLGRNESVAEGILGLHRELAVLPFVVSSFAATAVLFALWGVAVNAVTLPMQHRLVQIDPATSPIALSWFSTALYAGIALAPVVGGEVLGLGNAELLPVLGSGVTALAAVAFLLGWARRRRQVDVDTVHIPA